MTGRVLSPQIAALRHTAYPGVRAAMRNGGLGQSDAAVEEFLLTTFPEADPEDVENLFRSLSKVGKALAPVAKAVVPIAQKALPGAIQGAVQGGTIAGPWGAVAGALGGGAVSALSKSKTKTSPTAPAAPAAGSQAATAQLLALLARPEVLQALQALALGTKGRGTVRVSARPVPPTAIANAIAELAAEAARAPATDELGYYLSDDGSPRCDLGSPTDQAARLMADLAEADAARAARAAQLRKALHRHLHRHRPRTEIFA